MPLSQRASLPDRLQPASLLSSPTMPPTDFLPARKNSLPTDTLTVRSGGAEFLVLQSSHSTQEKVVTPSTGGKLFSKLQRNRKKPVQATEQPKSRSLLPAFNHRSRSESCSGTVEITPTQTLPVIAEGPSTSPRPVLVRPKIVRRASSAGELSALTVSNPTPLHGPHTPQTDAKGHRTTLPASAMPLDTPPATPAHFRQLSSKRSSSLRNRFRTHSSRAEAGSSESSTSSTPSLDRKFLIPRVTPRAISPHTLRGAEDVASLSINPLLPPVDLNLADPTTLTIKTNSPLDFEWRCISLPGQELKYELVIRKADDGRTPIPFSPATFASTPTLSPSLHSPYFASPLLRTPDPPAAVFPDHQYSLSNQKGKPAVREDVFWTVPQPFSPLVHDLSSDSEAPLTPKRCGFVVPDNFDVSHFSPLPRHDMLPKSPTPRRTKRQSSKRQPIEAVQAGDSSESEWHEYDGFLNIFTKPATTPTLDSSIATRRGAAQLKLTQPSQNTFEPSSRWSETEEDDDRDGASSLFSVDSL